MGTEHNEVDQKQEPFEWASATYNLLSVINSRLPRRDRMPASDIDKLVQGGPADLETDVARELGNLMICGKNILT